MVLVFDGSLSRVLTSILETDLLPENRLEISSFKLKEERMLSLDAIEFFRTSDICEISDSFNESDIWLVVDAEDGLGAEASKEERELLRATMRFKRLISS